MMIGMLEEAGSIIGRRKVVRRLFASVNSPTFSICILKTNIDQFDECVKSFISKGFHPEQCEFLYIDNEFANVADAYIGINEFLQVSAGEFILLSHQDITLMSDDISELMRCLSNLTAFDPTWALCGNAGFSNSLQPVLYLSHPVSDHHFVGGPYPARVVSLDENFIVVRAIANLALSRDLEGFHHYGADLCTIADILGWRSYVIDFEVRHHSAGTVDRSYFTSRDRFRRKYSRALRPRWVNLITEKHIFIAGSWYSRPTALSYRFIRSITHRLRCIAGMSLRYISKS